MSVVSVWWGQQLCLSKFQGLVSVLSNVTFLRMVKQILSLENCYHDAQGTVIWDFMGLKHELRYDFYATG